VNRIKKLMKILICFILIIEFIGCTKNTKNETLNKNQNKEKLMALPYVGYVKDDLNPEFKGVKIYDKNQTFEGYTLYVSRHIQQAKLIDMQGNTVHIWKPKKKIGKFWLYAEMQKDGSLIVLVHGTGLIKIKWDSKIEWIRKGPYNHDFHITKSGKIYVIGNEKRYVNFRSKKIPIIDNFISIISPRGETLKKFSVFDVVSGRMPGDKIERIYRTLFINKKTEEDLKTGWMDVFHSNTVEVIEEDIGIANKGSILICVRNLNLVGILNPTNGELIWEWGDGILEHPHHPTILKNGNILVFDNGIGRKYSRIIEYDPIQKKIVWKYVGGPPNSFYSHTRGANQRLPNGNTLITESGKGRIFEVTNTGKIVWEFWNNDYYDNNRRAIIYRAIKYEGNYVDNLIN